MVRRDTRFNGSGLDLKLIVCCNILTRFEGRESDGSFLAASQALQFLATNLDGRNYEAISDACIASEMPHDVLPIMGKMPSHRDYRLKAIKSLAKRHKEADIRVRYAGREFPEAGAEYKVGGHQDGHIHVDFVRVNDGWRLKEIWLCR